jgi:methionine sulfoxide reductase catalytic subunit
MKELQVTPEHVYLSRREVLKRAGVLLASMMVSSACCAPEYSTPEPSSTLAPAREPGDYTGLTDEFGDPLTPLEKARKFGNYYEFTRAKEGITELAQHLRTSPWQVEVGGLVRNPKVFDLDDLRQFGEEERIYRLRCIEAWSMVIPWLGFPLHKLLDVVEPTSEAKFVRFEALYDPKQLPGQDPEQYAEWLQAAPGPEGCACNVMGENVDPSESPYSWPYVEGLQLDEAMHDLTLLATGMYGKPLPPENGAPVRLVVPWKYAFKSLKAVVKIDLVAEQPLSFWHNAMPEEHGFYANVNPDVPHPRWSQGREFRFLGQDPEPILPTLPFNGYAAEVASLYEDMDLVENY